MENSQAQGNNNPQAQENVIPSLGDMLGGAMATPDQIQNDGTPQVDAAGFAATPPTNTEPVKPDTNSDNGEDKTQQPPSEYSFLSGDGTGLAQEELDTRNQILGHFGASMMSNTGDLVDTNGNVVLTKQAFDKFIETGEVPVDKDGNQIKADGTILRQASDIQPKFIDSARELVETEIPLQLLDAEGKPKVYEDSAEGVAEYAKDVYNQGAINAVTEFLHSNPEVKDFFFHVANGNSPETYELAPIDYGSIDINTLDKAGKLNLIKTSLEKQNIQNAKSIMDTFELAGDEAITTNAADALIALTNLTKAEKEKNEREYLARQEQEKQETIKYWNEVKSAVDGNGVKNIKIPDSEKEAFFKYLAVPTDSKGLSQAQIDAQEVDLEFELMVDYLRYKKGNIDDLVNIRAKTNKIDIIRQRMKSIPNPKIVNTRTPEPVNTGNNLDLNLAMLLNSEQR